MPISGVLLNCQPEHIDDVRRSVETRSQSEIREVHDGALIVVTDTTTLKEDRAEVEALSTLDGVIAAHVVFSNIEDISETATVEKG
jgi:nitrate reductase NapAB chaperone NapD